MWNWKNVKWNAEKTLDEFHSQHRPLKLKPPYTCIKIKVWFCSNFELLWKLLCKQKYTHEYILWWHKNNKWAAATTSNNVEYLPQLWPNISLTDSLFLLLQLLLLLLRITLELPCSNTAEQAALVRVNNLHSALALCEVFMHIHTCTYTLHNIYR